MTKIINKMSEIFQNLGMVAESQCILTSWKISEHAQEPPDEVMVSHIPPFSKWWFLTNYQWRTIIKIQ